MHAQWFTLYLDGSIWLNIPAYAQMAHLPTLCVDGSLINQQVFNWSPKLYRVPDNNGQLTYYMLQKLFTTNIFISDYRELKRIHLADLLALSKLQSTFIVVHNIECL